MVQIFQKISPACIIPTCSNLWLMQLEGLAPVAHAGLSQLPAVFPAVTRLFLVVIQPFLEVTGVTRLQNDQYVWMLQLPPGGSSVKGPPKLFWPINLETV